MPEASVRGVVRRLVIPTLPLLVQLKRNWKVSVAALAHRLHALGLISEWGYRGVNVELSRYGRRREPEGIEERETSQVFEKVFRSLKQEGIPKARVAQDLGLHVSDLETLTFGLTRLAGSRRSAGSPEAVARRASMKLVR